MALSRFLSPHVYAILILESFAHIADKRMLQQPVHDIRDYVESRLMEYDVITICPGEYERGNDAVLHWVRCFNRTLDSLIRIGWIDLESDRVDGQLPDEAYYNILDKGMEVVVGIEVVGTLISEGNRSITLGNRDTGIVIDSSELPAEMNSYVNCFEYNRVRE
jgi:hypothetical protein